MAQPSFGGYVVLTTSTTAQNKTDINANLSKLLALIPVSGPAAGGYGYGTPLVLPDFDTIVPSVAQQLINEIVALQAIITASP